MTQKELYNQIDKVVSNYPTKHKEGFIHPEIEEIKTFFDITSEEKFKQALTGITCMMKDGDMIIYHCDIEHALRCGVEDRDLTIDEWD